jgi:hypothetical protein
MTVNAHEQKLENINQYIKHMVAGDLPKSASKIKNKAMFQKIKDIYQEPGSGLSMRFPSN